MDKTILELTNIGALQSDDVLPLAREGVIQDNCTTVGDINTFVEGQADDEPTEESTQLVKSGGVFAKIADAITSAIDTIKEWADGLFAKIDGYYSQMTVGSAENLVGQTVDSEAYLIRPTGGTENDVANGIAYVEGMEGNSCVWNQILQNGNFNNGTTDWSFEGCTTSVSGNELRCTLSASTFRVNQSINVVKDHKYMILYEAQLKNAAGDAARNLSITDSSNLIENGAVKDVSTLGNNSNRIISKKIVTATGTGNTLLRCVFGYQSFIAGDVVAFKNFKFFDLTLLGIDNLTTTAQVEAWLAQHVGTKPYYAYNAGEILSAKTLGIKTFGQNLLNPTTKQAKLIPYTWVEDGVTYSNQYTIKNIPSGATAEYTPDNTGVAESVTITDNTFDISSYGSGILELSAATANTYVCMKWNTEKDNDVVPYEDHTYDIDVRKVYGKVSGDDTLYQCYQNGMQNVNGTADLLKADEAVSRIGKRAYQSGDESDATVLTDKTNTLYVLETPITYTDLVYRDNGVDTPLGEFLLRMQVNNWSMEEQNVTPYVDGQPTAIPATISTVYAIDAVEQLDTLQKTSYFADDVRANLQAMLTCINTNCSTVLGGTFAVSDTATDKVFDFTFTPNVEPEVEPENEGE